MKKEDRAKKYFNCTASERAAFEAGIKLGTVYHQFVGTPINLDNVDALERAIEASLKVQPFVVDARVRIKREGLSRKGGFYKYLTLTGDMLDVDLVVQYEDRVAICKLQYVEEMDYPLMYIKEIRGVDDVH